MIPESPLRSLPLALAVALTLGVAFALIAFTHPLGDDWCHAANMEQGGLARCTGAYYFGMAGRWPGFALSCSLSAGSDLVPVYRATLAAIALAMGLASAFLIAPVLGLRGRPGLALGLAAVLYALHWAAMPDPGQTVYWLEGAIAYSLASALFMALMGFLLRLPRTLGTAQILGVAGLAAVAVVCAALHELMALLFGGISVAGAALLLARRDPRWPAWAAVAVGLGVGFATGYLAPGNAARVAMTPTLPTDQHLLATALAFAKGIARVLDAPVGRGVELTLWPRPLGWLLDPRLLAASLVFVSAPAIRRLRPAWFEREPGLWRWLVPGVWLALLGGGLLAGSYAATLMGFQRALPDRVFNGLHWLFLAGWFLTLFVHSRWDPKADPPVLGLAWGAGSVLLVLGLLFSPSLKLGVRDLLRGDAAGFDRQMQERRAAARRLGPGAGELVLAPIENWPGSYFRGTTQELWTDPDFLYNQCAARYLGVDRVRLEGEYRPGPYTGGGADWSPRAQASDGG